MGTCSSQASGRTVQRSCVVVGDHEWFGTELTSKLTALQRRRRIMGARRNSVGHDSALLRVEDRYP